MKIVELIKTIWKSIVNVFDPIAPAKVEKTDRFTAPVSKAVAVPVVEAKPVAPVAKPVVVIPVEAKPKQQKPAQKPKSTPKQTKVKGK